MKTDIRALAHYRAMRSTALWFARLAPDGYSVTTHNGTTSFRQGENFACADYWLSQLRTSWPSLLDAHVAAACPCGTLSGTATSAARAASQREANAAGVECCICPECTADEIDELKQLHSKGA